MEAMRVKMWQKSDWNGFFGLFTNNVTNLLVFTGLLLYAVNMPADLVFGRILPGVGLAVFLCSSYYAMAGRRLARREGRDDVTALPSGISVPHMFLIVFMIMLPVRIATGDPVLAWKAGLAWGFIEGVFECLGALIGPWIRRNAPRAALLGSLAGVSVTYIMANAAIQAWEAAYISFACFSVLLLGWVARKRMPLNLPAGLCALVLGTILGWCSGYMKLAPLGESLSSMSFHLPGFFLSDILDGFASVTPFILVAIPMGIYNFLETIDNLESAGVAGDRYNTSEIMIVDGVTSMIGACCGNPVPTAVYIGHPGWKSVGARLGYALANGVCVLAIVLLGVVPLLLCLIPLPAILPILVYIGIVMCSQAFEHVPYRHFPAVVAAMLPWFADWGRMLVNSGVSVAGGNPADIAPEAFAANGIHYLGMSGLAQGAIVTGILWGSMVVFMVERKEKYVMAAMGVAAALSFCGIIHSGEVGVFKAPGATAGYLLAAAVVFAMGRFGYEDAESVRTDDGGEEK